MYLREEQRRVLESLEKNAVAWDERRTSVESRTECSMLRDGLSAYAAEQAELQRRWATHFSSLWQLGVVPAEREADDGRELDLDSCVQFSFVGDDSGDEGRAGGNADSDDD